MGIGVLTGTLKTTFQYQGQNQQTGAVYSPLTSSTTISSSLPIASTVANNASGGGDEAFSFQQGIIAGGKATLDLTAMTNIMQQAAVTIARLKAMQIRLLSAANDPTINPAPTATSTITVTNNSGQAAAMDVPTPLNFGSKGSGLTIALTVGATIITGVAIGAAGTGYPKSSNFAVTVQQAAGSGAVIGVTTNSSGVPTAVTFITGFGGTGYTAATVPAIELGEMSIYTGGLVAYGDPSAAGFCLVSSTSKNLLIENNDGAHAVTVEFDFFGATS